MPEFNTLPEAFEWFLENVYPDLPTEQKTSTLRSAKSSYYKEGENVSEKRMQRILHKHCGYTLIHRLDIKV